MPTRQPPSPNAAIDGAPITPSDTVYQAIPFRGIWVGGTGNITLVGYDNGTAVLYSNVPVGPFPYGGLRVNATGTTATLLVASY